MTIGEFADRCGLSAKFLHTYAEVGGLAPSVVDPETGYRYYAVGQLAQAALVALLHRAGVRVADIETFLEAPSDETLEHVGQRRPPGDDRVRSLRRSHRWRQLPRP